MQNHIELNKEEHSMEIITKEEIDLGETVLDLPTDMNPQMHYQNGKNNEVYHNDEDNKVLFNMIHFPIKCSHCDILFSNSKQLKYHLPIHVVDNEYQSNQSDNTVFRSSSLKSQSRKQTGERPYLCSHCDNAFAKLSNLKSHMRRHAGVRPYKCHHCEKAFLEIAYLKKHMRI
ncbi:unnamed protein product, partial [Meganyctiphanes norvegica]